MCLRRRVRRAGRRTMKGRQTSTCPPGMAYVGNVFLLGLATLIEELVDLQAANALEVLLEPFQQEQDGGTKQEILANDVQENAVIDLLDGLL